MFPPVLNDLFFVQRSTTRFEKPGEAKPTLRRLGQCGIAFADHRRFAVLAIKEPWFWWHPRAWQSGKGQILSDVVTVYVMILIYFPHFGSIIMLNNIMIIITTPSHATFLPRKRWCHGICIVSGFKSHAMLLLNCVTRANQGAPLPGTNYDFPRHRSEV